MCRKHNPIIEPSPDCSGFGIQFEASASLWGLTGVIGIEFVWYTSNQVTSRKNKVPYVYWYYSNGLSYSSGTNLLSKLIDKISKNPKGIFVDKISLSVSACAFAIKGYTKKSGSYYKFDHPDDYLGSFTSKSASIYHVKGFKSTSSKCIVYGAGGDISKYSIGTVYSYYRYATVVQSLLNKIANLYTTAKNKSEKVK